MQRHSLLGVFFVFSTLTLILFGGTANAVYHSADTTTDFEIGLTELLRVIQFYNSGGLHCQEGTEDGFAPGPGDEGCAGHDSDYSTHDWSINLTELLRLIQMYNARVYGYDPTSEDGYAPVFDPEDPTGTVVGQVDALRGYLEGEAAALLLPAVQKLLLDLLAEVEIQLVNDELCNAADTLDEFLDTVQSASPTMGAFDTLYADARALQYDAIVARLETNPCPGRERWGKGGDVEDPEGDAQSLSTKFDFGALRFSSIKAGDGSVYIGLLLPAVQKNSSTPGTPDIPVVRRLFAAPPGAFVTVECRTTTAETIRLNVMPNQPDPVDQDPDDPPYPDRELFADHPFTLDETVYGTDAKFPPDPCRIFPLGRSRDLEIYQIEAFAGQYNPVSGELVLFADLSVDIQFANGPDGFLPESAFNPFESRRDLYVGAVINAGIVESFPPIIGLPPALIGEELMIMTHPNFRDAADTLAAWKREKGIATNVYECGTGSGIAGRTTAAEIDAFIESHHDTALIKPSYILLLGDAEYISPFLRNRSSNDPEEDRTIGTDWPYAIRTYPGQEFPTIVPTFAVGRIPVDTLAQANVVVNKIIDYEKNPPGSIFADAFYKNLMFAAEFQCCLTNVAQDGRAQRTFTEAAEFVRAPLAAQGYTVQRIYRETVDTGCASCDPPRPAYTGDPTPRRYYDGTPLPASIGPGSGFSWNGTTTQITSAWNEGRFLILHRDHGWPGGWGTPSFNSSNADSLTNGALLPVVFSINCSSGLFDNEVFPDEGATVGGVYFAERLLRNANGGAVGVIGDTRVSPSWANSALTRGLFDAIWPSVVPSFGSNTPKRR
ncbi:MAG TPA: C25 family cysteine peptidase, partial [Candidatus Hydrogenedentes bacterium]|nr:C25 family cysteine peptidase [Candidatus Hydrogenedentota bacterium]